MSDKDKRTKDTVNYHGGGSETFESSVTAVCPFCGGKISDMNDVKTGEPTGLLHTMPMCEEFGRMDPTEFLKAVNAINASAAFDPLMKKEPGKA